MRSIHSLRIVVLALSATMFFSSCESDPSSSNPNLEFRSGAKQATSANPAIVYKTTVTSKGKTYDAVGVMDSNGSNPTVIYTAPSTSYRITKAGWSADGNTVQFLIRNSDNAIYPSIYLSDVSISRGKPVGSNTRSMFSASSYSTTIYGSSWSSSTSIDKIAFITRENGDYASNKVQTVSTSGGTPTVLYESNTNEIRYYNSPTWSPDGSKIAFMDRLGASGTSPDTLRVINASTGELLESVDLGYGSASPIEWSRSGADLIAFASTGGGFAPYLHYVAPVTGSTPWTNNLQLAYASWSPNNSSLVSWSSGSPGTLVKIVAGTATTSSITTGTFVLPNWKR